MNLTPRSLLGWILLLWLATPAQAADDVTGIWSVFTTTDSFPSDNGNSRWSYWLDAQVRYVDLDTGANQEVFRPAVGYRVHDNLQVWLGYARLRTRNAAGSVSHENRWFQQANWTVGEMLGGNVTMRARLLQRNPTTGDDLGLVFRLSTKYTRALNADASKTFIVNLEPFFDLRDTDWGGDARLSQGRLYAGMGWRISDKMALETGYMNQYLWRDGRRNTSNHLLVLNLKAKF
ncbi:MAG: DUF2490 domain-containing protein [Pseudomonadota bacterium]